ncbi:hypothetical protein P3T76_006024 [Phytophthora citrophthora]|uniref:SAP domain-containing protein n=1 Tax=Phytophthora citrophthora TaxID=4793 RepID=A0AAD9GQ09_9STRA|nr:hypothetical protein P3T76_006024 [Phytophthora citrophthora]
MQSLSELKDALTVLGVSTTTGNLRGEARRDELARRLHHAKLANGSIGFKQSEDGGEKDTKQLEKLSLSELRSALELRKISTQTTGLKGEARRHALIQRLMNSYSINQNAWAEVKATNRLDEEEDDETKSQSSSVYSTATEFIFYDSKREIAAKFEPKATSLMPQLSFTGMKQKDQPQIGNSTSVELLQRELFDLRTQLHTSRQEQQQLVDQSLRKAGIQLSLSEISAKLQALEREHRRLLENYFGHELVTCEVLSTNNNDTIHLELIQEDALLLVEKRQEVLKRLAKRTKEAMAVAKFHAGEMEGGVTKSARDEEDKLLRQIHEIEVSLSSASSGRALSSFQRRSLVATTSEKPGFMRCRSLSEGLHADVWDQMDSEERLQLSNELHSAASFHIRRDRVSLSTAEGIGATPADKLGMKARFLEKTTRNRDQVRQVYLKALSFDENHAENLGSYALFLCTSREPGEAQSYFKKALTADPTNAKNLANYANFLLREKQDYPRSEEYYKRALVVASKDVNVMGGYADLLSVRGKLVEARRILEKALAISPLHIKNQLRLALVFARLGENERAERGFERLLAGMKEKYCSDTDGRRNYTEILTKYANFLHQSGQWIRAKQLYDQALTLDPQCPSLLRKLYVQLCWDLRALS